MSYKLSTHFTAAHKVSGTTRMCLYNINRSYKSKHFRLVPLDILSDSDNSERCNKVIPGWVKHSEELA